MKIELYMMHGRHDPAQNMDEWGFNGPRLAGFAGFHDTYNGHKRVKFATREDFDAAIAATGWPVWDEGELMLEMQVADDLVETQEDGRACYYGDWGVFMEPAT